MSGSVERILIVEDEEPIRDLVAQHLRTQHFDVATAADGRQALGILERDGFDLVLSDVRMPVMDGIALLGEMSRVHPEVGILLLTGCEDVPTAVSAMKGGALDYILKPFRLEDLTAAVRQALERRRATRREADHRRRLEQVVAEQTTELRRLLAHLEDASENTLEALVAALDAREKETHAHSKRVGEYTLLLARDLGVDAPAREVFRRAAMLHDIGKIGVSDTILLKPAPLNEAEWREMRRHPEIGYFILKAVPGLREAAEIVLAHHERFDGRGYPRGLAGEHIPLGARVFALADSLDAITSDRPYQAGKSYLQAREEIARHAGTQFDPRVVEHFLRVPQDVWTAIRRRTARQPARATAHIAPLVLT